MSNAVRTKRIYDLTAPEDGYRLLIMRLWPRGIRKELVSQWEPELGPSRLLLKAYNAGELTWEQYVPYYLAEIASKPDLIKTVKSLARKQQVTLLCGCKDASHCHRTLLQGILVSILLLSSQA